MRELPHTPDHVACPACRALEQAATAASSMADRLFPQAAQDWLATRRRLSASSVRRYREMMAELDKFFGQLRLRDIHLGHVIAYQKQRQEQIRQTKRHQARKPSDAEPKASDGASRINHEISCLGQVMARAGLWVEIKKFYEPLPLPRPESMALSTEEETHLFHVAAGNARWFVAYCCALISRNTTAGPGEIRHLRLGDIELDTVHGSFLHIEEGVKNNFRKRPVPLNTDARWAVLQLLERANELGSLEPQHYLLPHRARALGQAPDPDRPMGSWKKAHYAMCAKAAEKFPRLAQLRLYDYRHTAMTDMLENPAVSFTTIEHMAGHRLNSDTKRKYDHLRNSALRVAADALDHKHTSPGELRPQAVCASLPPQRRQVTAHMVGTPIPRRRRVPRVVRDGRRYGGA
jgi:integrase